MLSLRNDISVVMPVYNEHEGIAHTIKVMEDFINNQPENYSIIFIDDGSKDQTVEIINRAQQRYDNIKLVRFSRNFGHQIAITAGIRYAKGDAVVVMDADLQDPPSVIPEMIAKWREGYQVVYGKRVAREGETFFKKFTAAAFYRLMDALISFKMPVDTGDFRLMDRQVVDELKKMDEPDPFVRGMVSWVGFKQTAVNYERQERDAGGTKYTLKKMIRLAMDGITSFSSAPLLVSDWVGGASIGFSLIYLLVNLFTGMTTTKFLVSSVFLMSGAILLGIGMLGTYLSRTLDASRRRPLYIVAGTSGFKSKSKKTPTFQITPVQRKAN